MAQIFLMTDKSKTKDVTCTHPACDNICRVNTFYAPSKARCPEHGGKAMSREPIEMVEGTDREKFEFKEIEAKVIGTTPDAPKKKNKHLGSLCCPFCGEPMSLLSISDDYKFISFGCMDIECNAAVEIQYNWRHAVVRNIPDGLEDLVAAFNREATIRRIAG